MNCPESQQVSCIREITEIVGRLDTYNSLLEVHVKRCDLLEIEVRELRRFQYMVLGMVTLVCALVPVLIRVYT